MTCTSVRYDSGLDHFVVTLKEDDHEWDFGIEISECNFKLTTDGVYSSVIAGMGYWTMDRCLCKEEDGDVYYRVGKSDAESSSSSKKSDDKKNSSSSGKKQSSSSKQVVVASIEDYEFVEINSQYWMKRDLDVFVEGSRCYNDDPANCEKYGRLYTWAQAMGINEKYNSEELGEISLPYQGICPEGTHLPSYGEWEDLFDFCQRSLRVQIIFYESDGWCV
jgi:Fibrobacter succinogenes major domain (Fib_succ_major).